MLLLLLSFSCFFGFLVYGVVVIFKHKKISDGLLDILLGFGVFCFILGNSISIKPDIANSRVVQQIKLDEYQRNGNSYYVLHDANTDSYTFGYTSTDNKTVGTLIADDKDIVVIQNKTAAAFLYVYEGNNSLWIWDDINSERIYVFVIPEGTIFE